MEYDLIRAIKILALKAVKVPDYDAAYRKICRWYSREFSTPLEAVYDIPEETVLREFFEDYYESIYKDKERAPELDVIIQQLSKKEEEVDTEAMEDEAWAQEMQREIDEERRQAGEKPQTKEQVNPNLKSEEPPDRMEIKPDGVDQFFDGED